MFSFFSTSQEIGWKTFKSINQSTRYSLKPSSVGKPVVYNFALQSYNPANSNNDKNKYSNMKLPGS